MIYDGQNNELLYNFLNRRFFASWRMSVEEREKNPHYLNYQSLELDLNPICSTNCKYCYLAKYGEDLFPKHTWNKKNILKNLELILAWLKKEKMNPVLEIFSGDPLVQNIGYEVMRMIYDWYPDRAPKGSALVIPTNMDFLHYDDKVRTILDFYDKFDKKGVKLVLSASVDGLYLEKNRPHRSKLLEYDDNFYDKLFKFVKATGTGFHPMIYSEGIELWQKNFLWFQEMFSKYDISCENLYLLEVRNKEWSIDQCIEFEKFLGFLVDWVWNKCDRDKEKMSDFIFKKRGFNILGNLMSCIGRGIGCSIQSTMMLRLGDLKFYPCHRTSYDFMESGQFVTGGASLGGKDEIIGIKTINPSMLIAIGSSNVSAYPMCYSCPISQFCQGGCLGSQYESTGDMFSPIPSVCRLMHYKVRGLFRAYHKIGMMPKLLSVMSKDKVDAYKFCLKEEII